MNGARAGGLNEKPVGTPFKLIISGRGVSLHAVGTERLESLLVAHVPKMQSRMTSVFSTARRKATSCASGAIGKLDEVEGGGAIKGRSRFSHCFLRRCEIALAANQPPDLGVLWEKKTRAYGKDFAVRFLRVEASANVSA